MVVYKARVVPDRHGRIELTCQSIPGLLLVAFLVTGGAAAPATAGLKTGRSSSQAPQTLLVTGDVPKTLTLSVADLKKMPRTTVTVEREGAEVVYEGVRVAELLQRAGVPLGRDLMGPALATYVLATAVDSYEVLFSIGELDPAVTPYEIIVADTENGKPLGDTQGQFRIVIPLDKRGARSVRMLDRLEVVRLRK